MQQKNDRISRVFTSKREYQKKDGTTSEFVQKYNFTTYSYVFGDRPKNTPYQLNCLFDYLAKLMTEGRPELENRKSVSSGKLLPVDAALKDDYITSLAMNSLYLGQGNNQHWHLQDYLLANDSQVIAVEVPVWNDGWLGHIDIIRWDNASQKLIVDDFKPNAQRERKASSQTIRYTHLLAGQLGLPLSDFRTGYFDKDNYYEVFPLTN